MNGVHQVWPGPEDELRAMVREILRDALRSADPGPAVLPPPAAPSVEPVRLQDDADLDRFVRRVAQLCEDPSQRAAIRDGQRRFTLGRGVSTSAPVGVHRIERGAVTERHVKEAAAHGRTLSIGRRAVLTPLARERARALGVRVDRDNTEGAV